MRDPIRIDCSTLGDVPDVQHLASLATEDRHIVLQFPPTFNYADAQSLILRLSKELLDFSVFYSSGTSSKECVTVYKVVDRSVVVSHADDLIAAAIAFRTTATSLCHLLADELKVPASKMVERCSGSGQLHGGWKFGFHGLQCLFHHTDTKQIVDVEIAYGNEFGVLDPYFFGQFVTSTSEFKPLGRLFRDLYHDCRRVLDVLEQLGRLVRIEDDTAYHKTGLVAID